VSFLCTSDQPSDIFWRFKGDDGRRGYIFDRRGRNEKLFDERFVKTANGSTSILTINNVQKSDLGKYSCREGTSTKEQSARLTVVG